MSPIPGKKSESFMNPDAGRDASDPLVTVCVTTYNREKLLPYTLESVIGQTHERLDIIVVDDHSMDGTAGVVSRFMERDGRIRSIRHETNKGLAAARNAALFDARGAYFTFIDDDDLWDETFVERFVAFAREHRDAAAFCCGSVGVDSRGRRFETTPRFDGALVDYVARGFAPPASGRLYAAEALKRAGG